LASSNQIEIANEDLDITHNSLSRNSLSLSKNNSDSNVKEIEQLKTKLKKQNGLVEAKNETIAVLKESNNFLLRLLEGGIIKKPKIDQIQSIDSGFNLTDSLNQRELESINDPKEKVDEIIDEEEEAEEEEEEEEKEEEEEEEESIKDNTTEMNEVNSYIAKASKRLRSGCITRARIKKIDFKPNKVYTSIDWDDNNLTKKKRKRGDTK
jgi:hypothetical protein